ncbi:MAG: hypothetical protein F9K30_20830 [Dechloromonas sp.]|nr:MAG: hypothetical protein F9K30_20830 [Dechloromonas sp.]
MWIVTSPWRVEFNAFVGAVKNTLRVVAPFYSSEPMVELLRRCKGRKKYFLLALEEQAVKGNFQAISAIKTILKDRESEVRFIRNLHAKFVVADEREAIVTSANLTGGGLDKNIEMGVRFNDLKIVKSLVHHFDALWAKAATITTKELEYYDALPRGKSKDSNRGKTHGPKVRFGKLPRRPPAPGTPALGWIIVHSEEAYKRDGDWESPMHQLKNQWRSKTRELDWGWTSPKMKQDPTPRRVLLAWKGEVFGHAIATIKEATEDEIAEGSEFFFTLTEFQWAKPVSFKTLPLGRRRRHHRGLIRLDEKILAAYWTRSK